MLASYVSNIHTFVMKAMNKRASADAYNSNEIIGQV
jgi:hypothetical protein